MVWGRQISQYKVHTGNQKIPKKLKKLIAYEKTNSLLTHIATNTSLSSWQGINSTIGESNNHAGIHAQEAPQEAQEAATGDSENHAGIHAQEAPQEAQDTDGQCQHVKLAESRLHHWR